LATNHIKEGILIAALTYCIN